jgi:hypothetical protein
VVELCCVEEELCVVSLCDVADEVLDCAADVLLVSCVGLPLA